MQLKQDREFKCVFLRVTTLDSVEKQLNELFEDGWQFHSVFTAVLANGGTADYAIVFR